MKSVVIGDANLMAITEYELLKIIVIEGCCPCLDFWVGIDNTMFSDTVTIDYYSLRTTDNLKSSEFTFFLDTDGFSFHYSRDATKGYPIQKICARQRLSLPTISFLIKQGYNIPL